MRLHRFRHLPAFRRKTQSGSLHVRKLRLLIPSGAALLGSSSQRMCGFLCCHHRTLFGASARPMTRAQAAAAFIDPPAQRQIEPMLMPASRVHPGSITIELHVRRCSGQALSRELDVTSSNRYDNRHD